MIISDLTYLELTVEPSVVVKGARGRGYLPVLSLQSNTAIVYQGARSNAKALSYGGDAIAISSSDNDSIILQGNF